MMLRTIAVFLLLLCTAPPCEAVRFVAVVPQPADAPHATELPTEGMTAVLPPHGAAVAGWGDYLELWRAHGANPADAEVRQRLGLPASEAVAIRIRDGRALARSLPRLRGVTWTRPQQIETKNFLILADLDEVAATDLARDLEQFFAVWTQWFFPLWKERQHWDQAAGTGRPAPRGRSSSGKLRVVVFGSPQQYAAALATEGPGIGRSTGYYASAVRTTFLRLPAGDADREDARATRYHELTHQLLAEATAAPPRTLPGQREGFWLLEGIACYMESTVIGPQYATVGGWEASRLQFARHRVLASGQEMPLAQLESLGQRPFQQHGDLAQLYAFASAHCHRLIDHAQGRGWMEVLGRLAELYRITGVNGLGSEVALDETLPLQDYLRLDEQRLTAVHRNDLMHLCLARCEVSPEALGRIAPQHALRWLDLTGLAVSGTDVRRLCPQPAGLQQLCLEATGIDDSLADWLAAASDLQELDLSWTAVGDVTLASVATDAPLETLWLTGTRVSDRSLERIAAIESLQRVDLQRTEVSAAGRERFRRLRPDVQLDPLELVAAP